MKIFPIVLAMALTGCGIIGQQGSGNPGDVIHLTGNPPPPPPPGPNVVTHTIHLFSSTATQSIPDATVSDVNWGWKISSNFGSSIILNEPQYHQISFDDSSWATPGICGAGYIWGESQCSIPGYRISRGKINLGLNSVIKIIKINSLDVFDTMPNISCLFTNGININGQLFCAAPSGSITYNTNIPLGASGIHLISTPLIQSQVGSLSRGINFDIEITFEREE